MLYLICLTLALCIPSSYSAAVDELMSAMEAETPGSVAWFVEWGQEEDVLDMYRDVLIGARPADTAAVHGYRFSAKSASAYSAILVYNYPEISASGIHEILSRPYLQPFLTRPVSLEDTETRLIGLQRLGVLPARVAHAISAHRDDSIDSIVGIAHSLLGLSEDVIPQRKLKEWIQIWLRHCINPVSDEERHNVDCRYNRSTDRFALVGTAYSALFRYLAISQL